MIVRTSSYDIFIGSEIFVRLSDFISREKIYSTKFILVDEHSREYCLPLLLERVPELTEAIVLEIQSGELRKTLSTCEFCWNELTKSGANRRSVLINLGGGVIGDIGGFAAATYMRGIDFINIPTTLLSMVDASAGGKNGINFAGFKNQVGTFTKPQAVFISPEFLRTLPKRELHAGFAEMIKHALISDLENWKEIKKLESIANLDWTKFISKSVQIKNGIVESDFKEMARRKILNFGHTIGHALESYSLAHDEDPLRHGEAIAFGMIAETCISSRLLGFQDKDADEIYSFIRKHFADLNFSSPGSELLERIRADKKNEFSEFNFVLLKNIGEPMINQEPDENLIIESIDFAFQQLNQPVQQ